VEPLHVLDLGNVLLRVDWQVFARGARELLPGADPEQLLAFCVGPEKLQLDRGRLSPLGFLELLARRLGAPEPEAVAPALLGPWTDIFTVLPGAPEAVERLALAGELWLLSDTDPAHVTRALNDHPFLRRFDRYLLSFAEGRVKTDPGAFELLAAEVRRGRGVVFFDDREDIVAIARDLGVPTVLFTAWDAALPTP